MKRNRNHWSAGQQAIALCSPLQRKERGLCRRDQVATLQRNWLQDLFWARSEAEMEALMVWLNLFPVNWRQLQDPFLLTVQVETLRQHLNSGFTQLLSAMALDRAVQISLNGPANQRGNPNENLGRELLELFSLGEGNYTEMDVKEAARALTGYRLTKQQQLIFDPDRHDSGSKTILGRSANFDLLSLVDWIGQQPATANHIARWVWRRRIGTTPTTQRLRTLADRWRQEKLSLPWLMREMTQSPEAESSRRQGMRIADPMEMLAKTVRLLGSHHPEAIEISLRGLRAMGQPPFEPPSVKGWPVNEEWLQLRWIQARRRTLQTLIGNEEIWDSRTMREELSPSLTRMQPLTLRLPAKATRENYALLFADPVWQLG